MKLLEFVCSLHYQAMVEAGVDEATAFASSERMDTLVRSKYGLAQHYIHGEDLAKRNAAICIAWREAKAKHDSDVLPAIRDRICTRFGISRRRFYDIVNVKDSGT